MSRIGKKLRPLPPGVSAQVEGNSLVVTGPKGALTLALPPTLTVVVEPEAIGVRAANPADHRMRSQWGTFSSLIANLITGVATGFSRQLEISGVGYKASLKGPALTLEVGFTHPVTITPPAGVTFAVEKNIITVSGLDKQLVGVVAARIRAAKPPEPYKGKGIKYVNEIIRRKAGKTAAKAAA